MYEDKIEIKPLTGVKTSVCAPPSKAHTLRTLFIASLANGESEIINPLLGDDQLYALEALKLLGVKISKTDNGLKIMGGNGQFKTPLKEIYLCNSGVSVRFLVTMSSLVAEGETIINGNTIWQQKRSK